tara:strand:+ start:13933 stop:15876 length:1944 start_codon:yes stop_codon:yes gene_type:complete
MKNKIKVSSSQFNYQYGDQIHFPYSIARLVSFLKTNEKFVDKLEFSKTCIFRDRLKEAVESCFDSDVLLCSCYVWNWEITTKFAMQVKEKNPNCLIIFGGPQVPDNSKGFFDRYPFVDIIVHGEGEYIIQNIFEEFLGSKNYIDVKGIETKDFRTKPEDRIKNLNELPSPYLTNTVWDLVDKDEDVNYIASWETNRGCPYQCTFCDWGSLTNAKMTSWDEEILFKEIEWFGKNKIVYVDCCDANFGIYQKRDHKLATKLKETTLEKGFPERIRPAWAKFSSDKIIPIAKELQSADLLRAVTLAVQSLDETTLEIVKRANIKFDEFSELTETFRINGIPTYTELIMGMPGETLESWKQGLETLVSDTKIGSIYIYNCGVFENAPMNNPIYLKHHGIKKIRSPIFLAHSSIHERGIPEYEEIAVGAKSFELDELKEINLYSWLIQTFSSLGLFEYVSIFYNKNYNLKFMKFFETFIEFCKMEESIFSVEYNKVVKHIEKGYSGEGWNHFDERLGDIFWPIEEASWLRLTYSIDDFSVDLERFLSYLEKKFGFPSTKNMLSDLIDFQIFILTTRENQEKRKEKQFKHNWKEFFTDKAKLKEIQQNYSYNNLVLEENSIEWGFKTIFYGRSSKKYKFHPEFLEENFNSMKF